MSDEKAKDTVDKSSSYGTYGYKKQRPDDPATRSISLKENERQQLADDIDAFLKKGGQIEQVQSNIMADPPKKPQSSYGSRSI